LHFIADQQQLPLITELAQTGEKVPITRKDAAFALEGFQQHGHSSVAVLLQRGLKAADVVVIEVGKTIGQGFKAAVVFRLACGGDGRQGAAMEAGSGGQDQWLVDATAAVAVLAGQLDGGLIGFGAGVAEEHLIAAAVGRNPARQLFLLTDAIQVGNVLQLP
jgi:hypothetical protein